jgi:hypothetical protein
MCSDICSLPEFQFVHGETARTKSVLKEVNISFFQRAVGLPLQLDVNN